MKNLLSKLSFGSLALVLAITLALLSAFVERTGPQLAEHGNMCGPSAHDPCYERVLKGGFPFAYLFDAPGVSVEHQLSFGEDDLFLGALALDVAVYYAIALLVMVVVTRSRA